MDLVQMKILYTTYEYDGGKKNNTFYKKDLQLNYEKNKDWIILQKLCKIQSYQKVKEEKKKKNTRKQIYVKNSQTKQVMIE